MSYFVHTNINDPLLLSAAYADDALTLSAQLTPPPPAPVSAPSSFTHYSPTNTATATPMLGSQASSQPAFLEASRSPPSKNLSHVPCKFFRQGTCQAGNTCPFSHSIDSQLEQAPCKYFQKGNCKFGAKCALAHILPDGRRVNHRSLSQNYGPLQLGARNILPDLNTNSYSNNPSALARSLIAQHNRQPPQPTPAPPSSTQPLDIPEYGLEYGASPPPENFMSPSSARTLGPLDVPMPASLESNGISYLARHGPIAASVPAKFGSLDASPPPSLPQQNTGVDLSALSSSHTIRSLYMSAFGVDSEHGLSSSLKNGVIGSKAGFVSPGPDEPTSSNSSPPHGANTATMASSATTTSGVQHRLNNMSHSPFGMAPTANPPSSFAGRRYVSSSFPARSSIWRGSTSFTHDEDDFYTSANGSYHVSNADSFSVDDSAANTFAYEEDFVPSSLNELLTPQERHRRGSRHDDNTHTAEYSSSISGRLGSTGAIGDGIISSSPRGTGMAESPRFGQLFNGYHGGVVTSNPNSNSVSAIGSPLRYSSYGTASATTTAGADSNGASSSFLSSSPLATSKKFTGGTVQRTPSGRRVVSSSTVVIEEDDEEDGSLVKTRSILKSEEDEDETQFIMDEEQLDASTNSSSRRSRIDGTADTDTVDAVEGKLNGLVLSR
ncbi:uncharacterized protein V1513DRAFT_429203 [Lipomyces chichibuensis]|uniref:uncharacterized protein n=1 Tax=Lipomyces chichibuensis TaxID=1546026 RepID=UPI0033439D0E